MTNSTIPTKAKVLAFDTDRIKTPSKPQPNPYDTYVKEAMQQKEQEAAMKALTDARSEIAARDRRTQRLALLKSVLREIVRANPHEDVGLLVTRAYAIVDTALDESEKTNGDK